MENYEQKYKKALERAKDNYNAADSANINVNSFKNTLIDIFPELKESEDERIRKALIKYYSFNKDGGSHALDNITPKQILAWLEKQDKKEYSVPYVETSIKDGVYLVCEDKNGKRWCELFNGHNDKENAIGVAFKFGQVSLRLYNIDIEECNVTTKQNKPCEYITSFDKAVCDFDGKRKTEMLFKRGLSCRDRIPNGWYIPAIGELCVMYLMKNQINKALKYIGVVLIKDECYWSSSETSTYYAWYLHFGNGRFTTTYKSNNSFRVRPVSSFNPLSL